MPDSEIHEPINWLLKRKQIKEGATLTGVPGTSYNLEFVCQECKKKYTRIVDQETFDKVEVNKTAWEWGWSNGG
jgi:hypothetical protein